MSLIFRKTAQGVTEVETRAHRLPPRIRGTLILVDGKRDVDDLRALVSDHAEETLRFLSEHGFIESVGETARPQAQPTVPAECNQFEGGGHNTTSSCSRPTSDPGS